MTIAGTVSVVLLVIALFLLGYLLVALADPEKFS